MNIFSMAYNNFKNNMRTYGMFFISMVFSVVILSNFFILINGEGLKILGEANANYTKMILQMVSMILGIFIFFFIWYTSNIFLKNRKKEIGLYTFMGVDSKTIGKIYFIEMILIGLFSCILGIIIGILISKFFQMIVFSMAGFSVDVKFTVTLDAILYTFVVFMAIFILMSVKGFINIIRSKVIDLINASKKTEKMPKVNFFTYVIAVCSLILVLYGYDLAMKSNSNAFKTLILVCVGTYGLFYALIPAVLKFLSDKKSILYKGENIITINSLAYRIKKNYTTYATIGILTACTVSVLGTAVSMNKLYTMSLENDTLYSISSYSHNEINDKEIEKSLSNVGKKEYELKTTVLKAKSTLKAVEDSRNSDYIILSYDQFVQILKTNGNEEYLNKINEDMVKGNKAIYIQRPGTLASLIKDKQVTVNDNLYEVSEGDLRFKTLGSILNYETIVVNNEEYNKIKASSETLNFYGIKVENDDRLLDKDIMNSVGEGLKPYLNYDISIQAGVYKSQNVAWLKIVYAIGAFLFLVFVLAEASIIHTKIYSDANEDKHKYKILADVGASMKDLGRAISKEVALVYIIPLAVGLIHSFFAIKVLGKFLSENLFVTFIFSTLTCILIFFGSCLISIRSFKRVVNVSK